jgi:hypothetical protein
MQIILSKHHSVFGNPEASHLPVVPMIIPSHLYLVVFHPMFALIATHSLKKMRLKKLFKNCYLWVSLDLVPALTHLSWSWCSKKKVLGACALIFGLSTRLSSKIIFSFISLMTFWMN